MSESFAGVDPGPPPGAPAAHDLLAKATVDHRALVAGLLGTDDPVAVEAAVTRWCASVLGSEVVALPWAAAGSGLAVAVDLADGRGLVVKARPAAQAARIAESRALQVALADGGLPVPRPTGPLAPFGPGGMAGAEVRVDDVVPIDARTDGGCEVMARLLHRVVGAATAGTADHVRFHEPWGIALPAGALWPDPPHDPGFDLVGTAEGAEAIDEVASVFRSRLVAGAAGRDRAVGHVDWRAEHVLVDTGGEVRAIVDWDAVVRAPEAVLVGQAAAGWTVVWGQPDPYPTVAEARAFVAAYEEARGQPFDRDERDLLDAAHGYVVAYGARCEHSDERTGRAASPAHDGWRRLLEARAPVALA